MKKLFYFCICMCIVAPVWATEHLEKNKLFFYDDIEAFEKNEFKEPDNRWHPLRFNLFNEFGHSTKYGYLENRLNIHLALFEHHQFELSPVFSMGTHLARDDAKNDRRELMIHGGIKLGFRPWFSFELTGGPRYIVDGDERTNNRDRKKSHSKGFGIRLRGWFMFIFPRTRVHLDLLTNDQNPHRTQMVTEVNWFPKSLDWGNPKITVGVFMQYLYDPSQLKLWNRGIAVSLTSQEFVLKARLGIADTENNSDGDDKNVFMSSFTVEIKF